MRRVFLTSLMLSLLVANGAAAQMRGVGRLQGNVFDKKSGRAIAGATITIAPRSGDAQKIVVKSDSKGHWAALGLTGGVWSIQISATGYVTGQGSARISEESSAPPIRTDLEPEAKQKELAPSIPQEAVDAIKEGEQLLRLSGIENAKHAAADFEKALSMIPEDTPELREVKKQVQQVLAQAYYRAGDVKGAIEVLEKLENADPWTTAADPHRTIREILLVNLYLEDGQLDRGKALLEKLPPSAISDPNIYLNIGVLFLNKKNAADAVKYLSKAVDLDPKRADAYYFRGLAQLQLTKNQEAKADFEHVLALAPDSREGEDSKKLLASLK